MYGYFHKVSQNVPHSQILRQLLRFSSHRLMFLVSRCKSFRILFPSLSSARKVLLAAVTLRCEHRCIILLWPREFCTEKVQGIYEPPTSLFPSQKEVLLEKVPLRCEHPHSIPLPPTEQTALIRSNCLIISRSQYHCLCHARDTAVPAGKNCSISWLIQQYHPTETAR